MSKNLRNDKNRVKNDGITELMKSVHWLDAQSLNNALLKANQMDLYVGLPPQITNITHISKYYDEPTVNEVSENLGFVEKTYILEYFKVKTYYCIYHGQVFSTHRTISVCG